VDLINIFTLRHLVLYRDVYPPVLRASRGSAVIGYRVVLSERNGGEIVRVNPLLGEVADYGYGASRGEVPVRREPAGERLEDTEVVCESLYHYVFARHLLERGNYLVELLAPLAVQLPSAFREEDLIQHRDLELVLELLYLDLVGGDFGFERLVKLLISSVQVSELLVFLNFLVVLSLRYAPRGEHERENKK